MMNAIHSEFCSGICQHKPVVEVKAFLWFYLYNLHGFLKNTRVGFTDADITRGEKAVE